MRRRPPLRPKGTTCTWSGTLWLGGTHLLVPLRLRGITAEGAVWTQATNGSSATWTFPYTWREGWWWRIESEKPAVSVAVPCDTTHLRIALNLAGTTLAGNPQNEAHSAEVDLVPGIGR